MGETYRPQVLADRIRDLHPRRDVRPVAGEGVMNATASVEDGWTGCRLRNDEAGPATP